MPTNFTVMFSGTEDELPAGIPDAIDNISRYADAVKMVESIVLAQGGKVYGVIYTKQGVEQARTTYKNHSVRTVEAETRKKVDPENFPQEIWVWNRDLPERYTFEGTRKTSQRGKPAIRLTYGRPNGVKIFLMAVQEWDEEKHQYSKDFSVPFNPSGLAMARDRTNYSSYRMDHIRVWDTFENAWKWFIRSNEESILAHRAAIRRDQKSIEWFVAEAQKHGVDLEPDPAVMSNDNSERTEG